ncbi:hypothetical protein RQP46_000186 [Phenoliferia psychrophenolica]
MNANSPDSDARTPTPGPSPLSPLKRQASQGAEPSTDVLHAGKRLRDVLIDEDRGEGGSGQVKPDSVDSGSLSTKLEAQITCGICQDVFYRPVSVIHCLHTFCGSCIAAWFEKTSTCPTCRAEATSTSDAYATAALVELYLGLPGNEQEGRSVEDKQKMDASYQPGQQLIKGPPRPFDAHNDDGFYDEEEDDDDEEDVWGNQDGDEEEEEIHDLHRPCPCCSEPNGYGYVCPDPTPDPLVDPAAAIPLHYPNPGHSSCDNCRRTFPATPQFGSSCSICKIFVCNQRINPICHRDRIVQPLKEVTFDEQLGLTLPQAIPTCFAGLASEQAILDGYLEATHGNVETLFTKLFIDGDAEPRRPKFLGPALGNEKEVLDDEDLVCTNCALAILESALEVEWPEMMNEQEVKDNLPAQVIARPDCWTAPHNAHHAQRLNHLCPPTRASPPALRGARTIFSPQAAPYVPPFDLTAITFRDLDGSPVALASFDVGGVRRPGKCVLSKLGQLGRYRAWGTAAVGEQEQPAMGNIEVLWEVEGEVKWVNLVFKVLL